MVIVLPRETKRIDCPACGGFAYELIECSSSGDVFCFEVKCCKCGARQGLNFDVEIKRSVGRRPLATYPVPENVSYTITSQISGEFELINVNT
jgi:C4-type Zn-finger protein